MLNDLVPPETIVLLAGAVMYLSKTIDHGEARFDSETGKPISKDENDQ